MSQSITVGINGFGRIGRAVLRASLHPSNADIKVVHINNLASPDIAAHLLNYDSVHGSLQTSHNITATNTNTNTKETTTPNTHQDTQHDTALRLCGTFRGEDNHTQYISYSRHTDPEMIPWEQLGVDMVLECSGAFNSYEGASSHHRGGAKRVLVSAPCQEAPLTVVYGVNDHNITGQETIISNASCTTNCLAVVAHLLCENFGVDHASMSTVHAYTSDQKLLDGPHKDLRRARSAALSMIPTTTGAAKMVGEVVPKLKDKIHGMAIRVPTANVSLTDAVFALSCDTSIQDVHAVLTEAAANTLKGVLGISALPLVSCDYNGSTYSATVDTSFSKIINKRMCKLLLWYDNETGFSWRMLDVARSWIAKSSA
ncbi:MAG: type I glyceraldehyde-3-phosphate dehydrogenase [Proteobacteria bacterium]|nr:type I glyceraldehyde-3-phosphate dehydrogenase [Pseudomonadota bacterium]